MRVHLLQYDIAWEDKPANHAKVRAMLAATKPDPGDLVVLPELFDTGFSFNLDTTTDDGTTANFLAELAREHRITVHGGLTARNTNHRGLNRALALSPQGQPLAQYDKLHPFSFGRESEFFDPGNAVTTYPWQHGSEALTVAPLICYDLRFPEAFRACIDRNAEAFALGANWPSARQDHWDTLIRARAIENQAYVFAVNRIGQDPTLAYTGGSAIIDAQGNMLAHAGDAERVISALIDPAHVRDWRARFPALRDRRQTPLQ